ncbi:variable surface protein [Plasmodium gonderi]|uniref:Variable surface protein n=1 Tax=Plasmodium gonderi TaxID=77519 RepID=A0A1Y1JXH5_PLAGO|nr:variable surface protein [Plasmodium gonderi]GAW84504.1 variable surface protein [Plasmodium gonderi]
MFYIFLSVEIEFPDLPSYKRYNEMNKEENLMDINGECVKLGLNNNNIIKFCKRIVTFLIEASTIPWHEQKSYCYFFHHWFFDNIRKFYCAENINNKQVVDKLIGMVSSLSSKYSIDSSCNCAFSGTPLVWKEEKDLHDYHVNFKYINCNNENEKKCEKYVEYITYIKSIYEKKENFDPLKFKQDFCYAYIDCDYDFNPNILLNILEAKLQIINKTKNKVSNGTSESITFFHDIAETINKLIKSDYLTSLFLGASIMGTIIYLFYNFNYSFMTMLYIIYGFFYLFYFSYYSTTFGSQMHKRGLKKKRISRYNYGKLLNELSEDELSVDVLSVDELESLFEYPQERRSFISYHTGRVHFD